MKSVFSTTVYSVTSDQAKKPCGTKSDSYTRTYIDDIFTQRLNNKKCFLVFLNLSEKN